MNSYFRFSAWCGVGSVACFGLAWLEQATGIVSRLAPTEAHLAGWLAIIAVAIGIVRNMRPGVPSLAWKWPRPRYASTRRRYARTRREVP